MNAPLKPTRVNLARNIGLLRQIPYWFVDGSAMVLSDGTIGFGYEYFPRDIGTATDATVNELSLAGETALRALPTGSVAQFLILQGPVTSWENYEKAITPQNEILRQLRTETRKHLEKLRFRARRYYAFVSVPNTLGKIIHDPSVGGKGFISRYYNKIANIKLPSEVTVLHHREARDAVRGIGDAFASALARQPLSLEPRLLTGEELLYPIRTMLNFTASSHNHPPIEEILHSPAALLSGLSLRQHLISASLVNEPNNLFVGDPLVPGRCFVLGDPPSSTFTGMGSFLSELDSGRYAVTFTLRVGDQHARFRKLERARKRAHAKALSGPGDVEAAGREENITNAMHMLTREGYIIYDANLSIFTVAPDIHTLNSVSTSIKQHADAHGLKLIEATMRHLDVWRSMLPFNGHRTGHDIALMTNHAADLLPIYGNEVGDPNPLVVTAVKPSRNSTIKFAGDAFGINPLSMKRTNWNSFIVGQSGSGKTFTELFLLTQSSLASDSQLIVVDVGGGKDGSYYRLNELMGGNYVEISASARNAFNPFLPKDRLYIDDDGKAATEANPKLMTRMQVLVRTLVDEIRSDIGVLEEGVILTALQQLYERSTNPTLRQLHQVLGEARDAKEQDKSIWNLMQRRLGASLDSYAGRVFGGERQLIIDVKTPMTVYDLMGIEALGHRQATLLLLISNAIADMRTRPNRKSIAQLLYDEVWKPLQQSPQAADIIEEDSRVSRKYLIGLTAVSQSADDFKQAGRAGKTIIRNSSSVYALSQKPEDADLVGEMLGLNAAEITCLKGLASEKGRFSEVFYKDTSQLRPMSKVLRIFPSPFQYWLATTDGGDKRLEAEIRHQTGYTGRQLIQELATRYPNGLVGGEVKPGQKRAYA